MKWRCRAYNQGERALWLYEPQHPKTLSPECTCNLDCDCLLLGGAVFGLCQHQSHFQRGGFADEQHHLGYRCHHDRPVCAAVLDSFFSQQRNSDRNLANPRLCRPLQCHQWLYSGGNTGYSWIFIDRSFFAALSICKRLGLIGLRIAQAQKDALHPSKVAYFLLACNISSFNFAKYFLDLGVSSRNFLRLSSKEV